MGNAAATRRQEALGAFFLGCFLTTVALTFSGTTAQEIAHRYPGAIRTPESL
jgi:hypothetical protein